MPPVIPQPLYVPSRGYQQRPVAEQLLLTLASQAPNIGMSIYQHMQQSGQQKMQDENAAKILTELVRMGAISPELGEQFGLAVQPGSPGQAPIPLQGNIPGPPSQGIPAIEPQITGDIQTKGAQDLLGQLLAAQQSQASIEASRAATAESLGRNARAEELQPYKIKESEAATKATVTQTAWTEQQMTEAKKLFPLKQAKAAADIAYTEALTSQAEAQTDLARVRTAAEQRQETQRANSFARNMEQEELKNINTLASQIAATEMIPFNEALIQAAEAFGAPLLPSGKVDKRVLRQRWIERAQDPNYTQETWEQEGQDRLRNIALQSGLNEEDIAWVDSIAATADPDATPKDVADLVMRAAQANQQPYETLVVLARYLAGILGVRVPIPEIVGQQAVPEATVGGFKFIGGIPVPQPRMGSRPITKIR
jgi:hypothetical protein